jgi:DNA-damage-inducible protein D
MKKELIQKLHRNFEDCARSDENGVKFWLARELQGLLGYT